MKRHASMNRIYRLVWSRVLNAWIPVAEIARGRSKGSSRKLFAASLSLFAALAQAEPGGGQVVSGAGSIAQSGVTTTITQASQNLSVNWQSFNIAPKEIVNFVQPSASAIAVNRIFDTNASQILGQLNANGQVYLLNPNGIVFGQGSQVNVGGLVASTLDLNDASLGGNNRTFSGNGAGSIINQGTINAANGGYVALLGNNVSNQGIITAQLGTVALGAGSAATLTFDGNNLVKMQVDQSTLNNLAENKQLIQANGGQVLMTAGAKDALLASVVNNTGVIEARTVENHDGVITLSGGMTAGTVNVGGTLDASAPNGGNGGAIETSAANVKVADNAVVTTAAPSGNSGSWLIDPADFTIAATAVGTVNAGSPSGDISGATLTTALTNGSVTILSSQGSTASGSGNINVNDVVAWSVNKLTLNAFNNININANLNASNTASLALQYGQGAVAANNTSDIITHNGATVNLPAGTNNFTTQQGSNGAVKNYTVITSLGAEGSTTKADLQGMNGDLTLNYALGGNINAAGTATWNAGTGFTPVGGNSNQDVPLPLALQFTGTFNGLGHTISGLAINLPNTNNIGLFGYTGVGSAISNVGLIGGSVTGSGNLSTFVGGLVGNNYGTISNSYTTGSVSGNSYVGGLAGSNSGTINNSYATGNITGIGAASAYIGGLVGGNFSPSPLPPPPFSSFGIINNSYATGNVSGNSFVGGLVGYNNNTFAGLTDSIINSYATGNVTGNDHLGGLVGVNTFNNNVSHSYATGTVTGNDHVGGLAGQNDGAVSYSYATGNASDSTNTSTANYVGGLVGNNLGTVSNSYAIGNVKGNSYVGGLIGSNSNNNSSIDSSYATGNVNGSIHVGGLAGFNNGTVSSSFWDITHSGQLGSAGGKGLTSTEMETQANFTTATAANGSVNPNWDFTHAWVMYDGHTAPLLRSFMTALTVTANDAHITYNGLAYNGSAGVTYSTPPNMSNLLGSPTYTGGINAGNYTITPGGLYSNQQGYIISYANGTLTINPATLTVTANAANRLYGAANPAFTGTVSGFVSTDTLANATTGTETFTTPALNTSNVGSYAINGAGLTANNGNYVFAQAASNATALTINPATLTVTANAANRLYGAADPAFSGTVSGFVLTDTLANATTGAETFTTPALNTSNVGSYAINGAGLIANNGNYVFAQAASNATALTINTASLTVTADNQSRLYGAVNPLFTETISGFVNGESAAVVTGSATGSSTATPATSVGTAVITASNAGLSATNYNFSNLVNGALTINPATLTVTANAANRLYGAANPAFSGTVSGFVLTDTLANATTGAETFTTPALNTSNVGSYAINGAGLIANNGNYVFAQAASNATALTINKASLTVTADNQSRLYGAVNPLFTETISGFVNGENAAVVTGSATGSSTATPATGVGAAVITASNAGLSATNYNFSNLVNGALTINPATLTVTANAANRLYGAANPAFTGTVSGFVSTDTLANATTGTETFTTPALNTSNVGSYAINGAGLIANNGNYVFAQAASNATALTINKASLTVTADNQSRLYGAVNPLFTETISGFVNGENAAVVTGSATGSSTATPATSVGTAVITASNAGLSARNYNFNNLVDGTLTINPLPPSDQTVTSSAAQHAIAQLLSNLLSYRMSAQPEAFTYLPTTLEVLNYSGIDSASLFSSEVGNDADANFPMSFEKRRAKLRIFNGGLKLPTNATENK